jgi:beta-mannosidase
LGDPNIGLNALYSEWVALQYYQYFKEFTLPDETQNKDVWLVFDQLDLVADIYLNGKLAGKHKNAHHPCRINITDKIKEGKNILTVALESGLYDVSEKAALKYGNVNGFIQSIDKRHYQRKPQYQFNWDWNPRYINVGITGDVRLEWADIARLDQVTISQDVKKDLQSTDIKVQSLVEGIAAGKQLEITVSVLEKDLSVSKSFSLKPGLSPYAVDFVINNPELWWPAQQGDQFRYTFKTDIRVDGSLLASQVQKVGLRRVEVDQSPHPEKGNYFTIKINNRPVLM